MNRNVLFAGALTLGLLVTVLVPAAFAHKADRADWGRWSAEFAPGSPDVKLSMSFGDQGKGTSHSDFNAQIREFSNINFKVGETNPKAHFELTREAGTFFFDGVVNESSGAGKFTFKADPAYVGKMKALGYSLKGEELIECALFDVSTAYINEMRDARYNPTMEQLVEMRIFHVDRAEIADMQKLKGSKPTIDELVEARIFNVDSKFAEEAKRFGFGPLSMEDLTAFRIHGVDQKFLENMKQVGYSGFSAEDAVSMRIHGVTPEFIRELKDLGYSGLTVDQLVEMRIFGVDPAYIRRQQKAGRRLTVEQLVERKMAKAERGDMI